MAHPHFKHPNTCLCMDLFVEAVDAKREFRQCMGHVRSTQCARLLNNGIRIRIRVECVGQKLVVFFSFILCYPPHHHSRWLKTCAYQYSCLIPAVQMEKASCLCVKISTTLFVHRIFSLSNHDDS